MQKLLVVTVVLVGLVSLMTLVSAVTDIWRDSEGETDIMNDWWDDTSGNWEWRKLTDEESKQQFARWSHLAQAKYDSNFLTSTGKLVYRGRFDMASINILARGRRDEWLDKQSGAIDRSKTGKGSWFSRKP